MHEPSHPKPPHHAPFGLMALARCQQRASCGGGSEAPAPSGGTTDSAHASGADSSCADCSALPLPAPPPSGGLGITAARSQQPHASPGYGLLTGACW